MKTRPVVVRFWEWMKVGHVGGFARRYATFGAVSKPGPLAVAQRIWRAMRRHGASPAPIHYVAVATIGTFLGAVLNKRVGVRWWLSPVLAVAGAWTLSVLPVWVRGSSTPLLTELLIAIDPEKGWERRRREEQRRIRESPIVMFEVADWPGWRILTGWGTSGGDTTHVTLGFAADEGTPPTVWTFTFDADHFREDNVRSVLVWELAGIATDAVVGAATPEAGGDAHLSAAADALQSFWEPSSILVDETELDAWTVITDLGGATYGRVDQFWVATVITGTAPIALRVVSDDSPYLDLMPPHGHTRE